MNLNPRIDQRLTTEERVRLCVEQFQSQAGGLPSLHTIALITGARSEALVKSVLYDIEHG